MFHAGEGNTCEAFCLSSALAAAFLLLTLLCVSECVVLRLNFALPPNPSEHSGRVCLQAWRALRPAACGTSG